MFMAHTYHKLPFPDVKLTRTTYFLPHSTDYLNLLYCELACSHLKYHLNAYLNESEAAYCVYLCVCQAIFHEKTIL